MVVEILTHKTQRQVIQTQIIFPLIGEDKRKQQTAQRWLNQIMGVLKIGAGLIIMIGIIHGQNLPPQ